MPVDAPAPDATPATPSFDGSGMPSSDTSAPAMPVDESTPPTPGV